MPTERKLRILMISPQFRPIVGGYERAAERLSGALADLGHDVEVIAERRSVAWPRIESIAGFRIRRLWCLNRRHLHISTSLLALTIYLLTRGRRFDIWHVHQYGILSATCVLLGKLVHRPVVFKSTNTGTFGIAATLGNNIVGDILGYLHRHANACIVVSNETREEAIRFNIPSGRIHLIPNGLDGHQFRPASPENRAAARRALGLECTRVILIVGRLSPEKNPLGLLDAWSGVDPKTRVGAQLVFVGDGPDFDRVRAKVKVLDLAGSVYLAGMQSDVATWYQAADVCVISSHNEGLSNTMIEALASGLPVISTRVSGSSVLLEPPVCGHVVSVSDIEQLADAIGTLLQQETERVRLGENARLTFNAHFSIETVTHKMISLYEELRNPNQNGEKA